MKPRFANVGNPALRNLYLGDTEPYTPPAEELEIPSTSANTFRRSRKSPAAGQLAIRSMRTSTFAARAR
jgi:hypothetical protein